jgi:hypothetical protein
LATEVYPKLSEEKLHINTANTQFCLNTDNTSTERLQVIELSSTALYNYFMLIKFLKNPNISTKDLASNVQILMKIQQGIIIIIIIIIMIKKPKATSLLQKSTISQ